MTYAVANQAKAVLARHGVHGIIVPVKFVPTGHCADTRVFITTPESNVIDYGLKVGDNLYTTFG